MVMGNIKPYGFFVTYSNVCYRCKLPSDLATRSSVSRRFGDGVSVQQQKIVDKAVSGLSQALD